MLSYEDQQAEMFNALMLMEADVVSVTNRSKHPVEFMYNGVVIMFKGKETRKLPRYKAEHGFRKLVIKYSGETGEAHDSFLSIEGYGHPSSVIDFSPKDIQDEPRADVPSEIVIDTPEGPRLVKMTKKRLAGRPVYSQLSGGGVFDNEAVKTGAY